jgi:hypothetical protein
LLLDGLVQVWYTTGMSGLSRKDVGRLLKDNPLVKSLVGGPSKLHCPICNTTNPMYFITVQFGTKLWDVIYAHKTEHYGRSAVLCTKKCFYTYIQTYASDLLFKML